MKNLLLIIALFAFLTSGLAEAAHAEAVDYACSHQTADFSDAHPDCDNPDHDHDNIDNCQDCGCHHTHVLTKILPDDSAKFKIKAGIAMGGHDSVRTRQPVPLYRPPIA